jgi:hypothetical protein
MAETDSTFTSYSFSPKKRRYLAILYNVRYGWREGEISDAACIYKHIK